MHISLSDAGNWPSKTVSPTPRVERPQRVKTGCGWPLGCWWARRRRLLCRCQPLSRVLALASCGEGRRASLPEASLPENSDKPVVGCGPAHRSMGRSASDTESIDRSTSAPSGSFSGNRRHRAGRGRQGDGPWWWRYTSIPRAFERAVRSVPRGHLMAAGFAPAGESRPAVTPRERPRRRGSGRLARRRAASRASAAPPSVPTFRARRRVPS